MAIPTDSRALNQVLSLTRDEVRPQLIDLFFNSNPLFARLMAKNKVKVSGGDEIRVPFVYDQLPGDWYVGLGPFATTQKEIITVMRFDWKQVYAEYTLPEIDIWKNSGTHQLVDLVAASMKVATMTIAEKMGTALYNDGTNTAQLTGLRLAIATTGTYGKIVRGTDPIGTAVKGNVDTTGGPITIPFINSLMGTASRGGAVKPDLLLTTQTLWDAVWARVQPQQRFDAKSGPSWDVGVDYININGSALVADSHCPTGYLFGLNTDYTDLFVGEGKDFYVRGPYELQEQDGVTAQTVLYTELCISSPGLFFNASGLTA